MKGEEFLHIFIAIITLTAIISLSSASIAITKAFIFSLIIITVNISAKKIISFSLDSDVEHRIWSFSQYGFKKHQKFKNPVHMGIILPLILSFLTLGTIKLMSFLTYETKALKRRAAKRFGPYSYTEMTEWHNALIGAGGIVAVLLLSIATYLLPASGLEILSKLSIYYALSNILPISNLDGTQIFFGSRVLYTVLAATTLIFALFAFALL